ncbi:MAG: GspH/FimT family pseudopilin [Methylococcaceae bacterium]|nr:GspH/FimT family pseudopilin [Methylococcaceae bacterium]
MNKIAPPSGFTLIELMVTLSVAAIVLTLAVPSFESSIQKNRLATQSNQLITALNLARSEAIKRGVQVTVCKSANGSACTTSGGWEQGWVVFVDNTQVAGNVAGTIDGTDQNLRAFGPLSGKGSLSGGGNFGKWIAYLPSGISRGDTGLANGTFSLCSGGTSNKGKSILINNTGRVRVEDTTC